MRGESALQVEGRDRGVGKGHTLAIREGRKWEM